MQLLSLLAQTTQNDIEATINELSIQTVMLAALILVTLLLISSRVVKKKRLAHFKKPLFILIVLTIVAPSLLLTGSTIYINSISDSKGPVHWHTDIEFWVCGQEIELRDPEGAFSNKIGTSTYHEHDDKRIHLEGVVVDKEYDASLEKFMDVTSGKITTTELIIATNEDSIYEDDVDGDQVSNNTVVENFVTTDDEGKKVVSVKTGDSCGDGEMGAVQAFLIRYDESTKTYKQTKLEDPARYTMRDESVVPPGDCMIIEFDRLKDHTDYLCQQYGVRDDKRCVSFGVSTFNPKLCNIREIRESDGGSTPPTDTQTESTEGEL